MQKHKGSRSLKISFIFSHVNHVGLKNVCFHRLTHNEIEISKFYSLDAIACAWHFLLSHLLFILKIN